MKRTAYAVTCGTVRAAACGPKIAALMREMREKIASRELPNVNPSRPGHRPLHAMTYQQGGRTIRIDSMTIAEAMIADAAALARTAA
jgi:hypothetical protein